MTSSEVPGASAAAAAGGDPPVSKAVRYDLMKMRGWTSVEALSSAQPAWLRHALMECVKAPDVCFHSTHCRS